MLSVIVTIGYLALCAVGLLFGITVLWGIGIGVAEILPVEPIQASWLALGVFTVYTLGAHLSALKREIEGLREDLEYWEDDDDFDEDEIESDWEDDATPSNGNGGEEADENSPRPRPSRNAPCPCGSGKKYKLCCGIGD